MTLPDDWGGLKIGTAAAEEKEDEEEAAAPATGGRLAEVADDGARARVPTTRAASFWLYPAARAAFRSESGDGVGSLLVSISQRIPLINKVKLRFTE